jgi:NADH-quinone oxidoreductase subunit A
MKQPRVLQSLRGGGAAGKRIGARGVDFAGVAGYSQTITHSNGTGCGARGDWSGSGVLGCPVDGDVEECVMGLAADQGFMPVLVMAVLSALVVTATVLLSLVLGPHRKGSIKSIPYESGVDPVGSARGRFHARFYLLAILFLIFDVQLVFLYPWAVVFHATRSGAYLLGSMLFAGILLVAFVYAWIKAVFNWR